MSKRGSLFLSSFLFAILMIAGTSTAFAEGQIGTDEDAAAPAAPSGTAPRTIYECRADPVCGPAIKRCEDNLQTSRDNADRFADAERNCRDTIVRLNLVAPTAALKPAKWACHGSEKSQPAEKGNDCTCNNPAFVAVTETPWVSKVCVPRDDLQGLIGPLAHRLDALESAGDDDLGPIRQDIAKLKQFAGNVDVFIQKYTSVLVYVDGLEARLRRVDERLAALESRSAVPVAPSAPEATPRHSVSIEFEGLAICRQGASCAGGLLNLNLRETFWFGPESRLAGVLMLGAGRYLNYETDTASAVGAGLGVRFDLTRDRKHSLEGLARFEQIISDHAAGYQGVLEDQGMGFMLGGQVGYRLELFSHLNLGCRLGFGGGQINYFRGRKSLAEDGGLQPFAGCAVGGHIDFDR